MKPLPFTLRLLTLLAALLSFTWVAWAEDDKAPATSTPDPSAPADQAKATESDSKDSPAVAEAPDAAATPVAAVEAAPAAPAPVEAVEASPATKVEQPASVQAKPSTSTEAPALKANSNSNEGDKPASKEDKSNKKKGKKKHSIQIGAGEYHSRKDAPPFGNHTVLAGEKFDEIVSVFGNTQVDGEVESDAVAVFGNNEVKGKVGSDAVAVFGNLTINGEVGGDAVAVFGNLNLGPNAKVNGECVNVFGHVTRDPNAEVGNIQEVMNFAGIPHFGGLGSYFQNCILRGRLLWFGEGLTWAWVLAGAHLLFYFLLALVLKKPTEKCVDTLVESPGMSILAALLAFLLSPLVIVLLAITGVGVILIPFLAMFLFFASIFGRVVMHAWIGRPITRLAGPGPLSHIAFAVLVGGVIISFLYCIPLIAFMVHALLGTIGLGVVILVIMRSIGREKRTTLPPATPAYAAPMPAPAAPAPSPSMPAAGAPLDSIAGFAPAAPLSQPPVSSAGFVSEPSTIPTTPQPVMPAAPAYQPFAAGPRNIAAASVVASSLPRASFWIRMGALVIDLILVSLLMGSTDAILPGRMEIHFFPGIFFFMALYGALMWKLRGTTIGGIICKLQLVRTDDRPLDWATCIVRALGCVLSAFVVGLGFIWIAIDPNRESWHDKIAGTAVVVNPTGRPLV